MTLVQYIIVRKDLSSTWSKGAIIAQACHGVTKCLLKFSNDEAVKSYTCPKNLNQMHKIILSAADEGQVQKLSQILKASQIDFVEWVEMPENIITSIVVKPYEKEIISSLLKNLPLYK